MLSIFKDAIRTRQQKARYFWAKRLSSVVLATMAFGFTSQAIGHWAIVVGLIVLLVSYVTIAPVLAAFVCLLEEIARL